MRVKRFVVLSSLLVVMLLLTPGCATPPKQEEAPMPQPPIEESEVPTVALVVLEERPLEDIVVTIEPIQSEVEEPLVEVAPQNHVNIPVTESILADPIPLIGQIEEAPPPQLDEGHVLDGLTEVTEEPTFEQLPEASIKEITMTQKFLLLFAITTGVFMIITIVLSRIQKRLETDLERERFRINSLGVTDLQSATKIKKELEEKITAYEREWSTLNLQRSKLLSEIHVSEEALRKIDTRVENQKQKLVRQRELYSAIDNAIKRFYQSDIPSAYYRPITTSEMELLDQIVPTVVLSLNHLSYQELRKEFRTNQKQIDGVLEEYAQRYTTKANQTIYSLMVISLRSELQNILYNLKFEKLDRALDQVRELIAKYLVIVTDGNQTIAGTVRKFVGQLEYLFENAVRIEYEYYIKREQARQEQLALRQQMREEAEERKKLEEQKKQIEFEEAKYQAEILKMEEQLKEEGEDSTKGRDILAKLEELNAQLSQVEDKKEEITKLQLGKAGNVYIISNLGSFGEHVFKIGMTRRLDPQDRVNELGGASVPFKFDVHSFIFSEDAVGLENELHKRLHQRRVNKVNLRKEFFDISLDELEQLVTEINPAAEFNRTMLAVDYTQSLSMGDQVLQMFAESNDFDEEDLEVS